MRQKPQRQKNSPFGPHLVVWRVGNIPRVENDRKFITTIKPGKQHELPPRKLIKAEEVAS